MNQFDNYGNPSSTIIDECTYPYRTQTFVNYVKSNLTQTSS